MTTPPSYKKVNPADSPILLLTLRSDTIPLTTVDEYADLFLAQQISQVPGVAQVIDLRRPHARRSASRSIRPSSPTAG